MGVDIYWNAVTETALSEVEAAVCDLLPPIPEWENKNLHQDREFVQSVCAKVFDESHWTRRPLSELSGLSDELWLPSDIHEFRGTVFSHLIDQRVLLKLPGWPTSIEPADFAFRMGTRFTTRGGEDLCGYFRAITPIRKSLARDGWTSLSADDVTFRAKQFDDWKNRPPIKEDDLLFYYSWKRLCVIPSESTDRDSEQSPFENFCEGRLVKHLRHGFTEAAKKSLAIVFNYSC